MSIEHPLAAPTSRSITSETAVLSPEATTEKGATARQQRALGYGSLNEAMQPTDVEARAGKLRNVLELTQALLASGYANLAITTSRLDATGLLEKTQDALPVAPATTQLSAAEVIERFEKNGAVKKAPRFADQVQDKSRQEKFQYYRASKGPRDRATASATESEGLTELHTFLKAYMENPGETRTKQSAILLAQAEGMLRDLTFIGKPEYKEADKAWATEWKAYLNKSPDNQLCVLAEIGNLERYFRNEYKSDAYVRDRILATFSDEDLEKYSGRIVTDLQHLKAGTENSRVIIPDDRSLSGTQLREVINKQAQNPAFEEYLKAGRVEVNLIVSSQKRIKEGLELEPGNPDGYRVPVKSYYVSHHSEAALYEHKSHVTDIESTGNYDFGLQCMQMAKRTGQRVPALAKIRPTYKNYQAPVIVQGDKLVRVREG